MVTNADLRDASLGITTLLIQVRPDTAAVLEEMREHFIQAWNTGVSDGTARITFPSVASLFESLPPDRWLLLECLQALGEVSLRTLARSLREQARYVHADVRALVELGMVERLDDGRLCVPYEQIRVEFQMGKEKP